MEASLLQKYDEWLVEHLEELMTEYPAKVVTIHEGKIVLIGDSEADVYRQVRGAGMKPMPLVFRVPREEDMQSILPISEVQDLFSRQPGASYLRA